MRRAFADRNEFMADPDFVDVPRQRLMSAAYLDSMRATIDSLRATPSSEVRAGLAAVVESDHPTHFSVVDDRGNAVAHTTTINELFGTAVTVTGAGFLLNDEMDDFAAKPGTPNGFGLVQGEANAIQPGKRMLSAMTPTIVLAADGSPLLVTGARGGPRIITAVFQVLTNVVDFDLPIDEAVRAPRVHHQHLPDVLYFEARGLDSATIRALTAMGHRVESRDSYIGNAPSILRRGDTWTGVADPRQGGLAQGY
jgi:gamma-glutamyltranspeptidase/glutathione hydrolase